MSALPEGQDSMVNLEVSSKVFTDSPLGDKPEDLNRFFEISGFPLTTNLVILCFFVWLMPPVMA